MDITSMTVNVTDKTIAINGEGYVCSDFPDTDPNIVSLSWHPKRQGRCKGSIHRHQGGGQGLNDFALLQPYVKAWEDARERTLSRKAMEQAEAQGAFAPEFPELPPMAGEDALQRLAAFDERVRETVAAAAAASVPNTEHDARLSAIESALAAIRTELAQDRANVADVVNQVASFGHTMSELIRQAKEG